MAACAFMVSCQWWHETFSSPEDCAVWYREQMAEAQEDGDVARADEIYAKYEEWFESLDKEDQEIAFNAVVEWAKQKQKEKWAKEK